MNTATIKAPSNVVERPENPSDNMTLSRIQRIEKSIYELKDAFEDKLTIVLIGSTPATDTNKTEDRTFLERSLGDVELALLQLRRIAENIVI